MMEPIVQAAVISGTAVITAAGIQAIGNVIAARKRLAEKPETKEIAQEVITARRIKTDWVFWFILAFMICWWVFAMSTADITGSRYMLGLIVLTPSTAVFMVIAKAVRIVLAIQRK